MISSISITNGTPTIFLPLVAIVLITSFKDLFEDLKRHSSDGEENHRKVLVYRNGKFEKNDWESVRVGEIIKVQRNEYFPCDVMLLNTSEKKSYFNQ